MLQLLTIARKIRAKMMANVHLVIGEATFVPVNLDPDTLKKTVTVSKSMTYHLLVHIFVHILNTNNIMITII